MASLAQLVNASALDVLVPNTALAFPSHDISPQKWLAQLKSHAVDRRLAFFDEHLQFLLILRVQSLADSLEDPAHPPIALLSFLAHVQVSYDASYISPVSLSSSPSPGFLTPAVRISTPPRASSLKPRVHIPPNIVPPTTPNPTPLTTEHDRRYVKAEGTPLASGVWGDAKDGKEAFALLWDAVTKEWVAVYSMSVNVVFLRMNLHDPLLCLTVSMTLREKPVFVTPARKHLATLIAAAGGLPKTPAVLNGADDDDDEPRKQTGLDEVNLLGGLLSGSTFAHQTDKPLDLPTTRLGPRTRRKEFALGPSPVRPPSPRSASALSPTTVTAPVHPTLRKSFRKTLQTVSGFRVRMRTVFVPYVLLPQPDAERPRDLDDELDELAAGHTERTVVLCVEIENSGESGHGFSVDDIDVRVSGGEGTRVRLITWDEGKVFPIKMLGMEQYNVLYAVEFLASALPEKQPLLGGAEPPAEGEMQRAVTINVHGRPFEVSASGVLYPTQTFVSRWNCILDLSLQRNRDSLSVARTVDDEFSALLSSGKSTGVDPHNALPEPASPFPTATPYTAMSLASQQQHHPPTNPTSNAVAGNKRHTLPTTVPGRVPKPPMNYRSSTSLLNPANRRDSYPTTSPSPLSKVAYTPPSIAVQSYARTPTVPTTTFAPPPPTPMATSGFGGIPPPAPLSPMLPTGAADEGFFDAMPPPTPAYPAYPSAPLPPTPRAQGPVAGWGGSVGPTVEIPRSRGHAEPASAAGLGGVSPSALGPRVGGGAHGAEHDQAQEGEKVVVSVGLLSHRNEAVEAGVGAADGGGPPKIYPHDRFTLDVFVFNQSSWTRRFEVSCPERRRRRQVDGAGKGGHGHGVVPLENRVRVGPLRPSTCQSVRMDFLALAPGVHPIETLTLTDVETGYSINLRSVMDVVVHEQRGR
ncbi:hypothetical protein HETIRDRAFT_448069 [Heterobasidion irregulare TC 32-1]|uniref:Trafficking protein particle complex II-specific subunit 65 IgD3 domain-containing protein n=1 Tax=Heterobasidion irregulare (strain TC 32-1) TaxID=747525 RepID=W4KQA8_HETIT|nr:uncharacterized protein HETIRDRAFT_448069 [Heterobasidion irregulare TC 32-1]ETW87585.1 hypothetical protein HETIRDRAFT_448069 [Heterobasidion irregulare TC 32-1]